MEHGSGGSEVLTQVLVFLGATCVLIPALKKARISTVMGFLIIGQTVSWLSHFPALMDSFGTIMVVAVFLRW